MPFLLRLLFNVTVCSAQLLITVASCSSTLVLLKTLCGIYCFLCHSGQDKRASNPPVIVSNPSILEKCTITLLISNNFEPILPSFSCYAVVLSNHFFCLVKLFHRPENIADAETRIKMQIYRRNLHARSASYCTSAPITY